MSVFTSRVMKSMTVSGLTVTYRKLSPKQLEGAGMASRMKNIQALKDIGGPEFLRQIEDMSKKAKDETDAPDVKAPESKLDPLSLFDRDYVLSKGILKWEGDDVLPLSDDAISDIDDETADVLARAILTLSKPSLFQSADEAESDRKNA